MVVLDHNSNGYRDIILPLACQDEAVMRAVSVVAAHHLSKWVPAIRKSAVAGQMAVVSNLRRDAFQCPPSQIFNLSTWATILVLLVGETITGGDDFIYLLEMVTSLTEAEGVGDEITASVRQFFINQTRM